MRSLERIFFGNMDKPKKTNLELKKEKVLEIAKKVEKAKTIVFANYHGLSASQISELREKVKEGGGELIVGGLKGLGPLGLAGEVVDEVFES